MALVAICVLSSLYLAAKCSFFISISLGCHVLLYTVAASSDSTSRRHFIMILFWRVVRFGRLKVWFSSEDYVALDEEDAC
jgi:hypothetical protein